MLRSEDNETEILLGNKQLLGIFFVVAILLGVAFYGGYMVGKAAPEKKIAPAGPTQETASSAATASVGTGGVTKTLPGDSTAAPNPTAALDPPESSPEPPLGTPKSKKPQPPSQPEPPRTADTAQTSATVGAKASSSFTPEPGQEFLQVAAVERDEALAVADVLHAKGFHAHAVQKPGNPKIYRVLIGPVRDATDLSTTRDALRNTGFREVIVQKY